MVFEYSAYAALMFVIVFGLLVIYMLANTALLWALSAVFNWTRFLGEEIKPISAWAGIFSALTLGVVAYFVVAGIRVWRRLSREMSQPKKDTNTLDKDVTSDEQARKLDRVEAIREVNSLIRHNNSLIARYLAILADGDKDNDR